MAATDSIDTFLRRVAATEAAPTILRVPATVGRYRVGARLGHGGLGLVHTAWDPRLGREVALKLVRPDRTGGESGPRLQARLRTEARALARLAHPHVVPVFDAGEVNGQAYVVMQKIEGRTLRRWLHECPRTLAEILEVYREAGEGLAAAHGVGVVHRDFKPDNVLVQPDGHAVVVDFGLAMAAGATGSTRDEVELHAARGGGESRLTEAGAILGTRGYIAPELRAGQDATARSDQYAFCIALSEALRVHAQVPAWVLRILERGLDPVPSRRWPSMMALLSAMKAGPRARNGRRAGVVAAALVASGLAWAATRSSVNACEDPDFLGEVWNDAMQSRLRAAIVELSSSGAVALHDRFAARIESRVQRWGEISLEICARADELGSARVHAAHACLQGQADELAAMLDVLVDAPTPANAHHALATTSAMTSPDTCADDRWLSRHEADARQSSPAVRDLRRDLWRARALGVAGRYAEASAAARAVARESEALDLPALRAAASIEIGRLADADGAPRQARDALEQAYYLAIECGADDEALEAATLLVQIAGHDLRQDDEAMRWAEIAASSIKRLGLQSRPAEAALLTAVGTVHRDFSRLDEAEAAQQRALAIMEDSHPSHPLVATLHADLGSIRHGQGRYEEAEASHRRAVELRREILGPDHPSVAIALGELGTMQFAQRHVADAERSYTEAIAIAERSLGPRHIDGARIRGNLGPVLLSQGRVEEAAAQFSAALSVYEATVGSDHPDVGSILHGLAHAYRSMRRFDDAERTATRAVTLLEQEVGTEHVNVATALGGLALVYLEADRPQRALPLLERALAIRERHLAPEHPDLGGILTNLGNTRLELDDPGGAERDYDRAIAIFEGALGTEAPVLTYPLWSRARARDALGRPTEALADAERALALRRDSDVAAWELAESEAQVAMLSWKTGGDREEAMALARSALTTFTAGGETTAEQRTELEAWLAGIEHPGAAP